MGTKRGRRLTETEAALWGRVVANVDPLKNGRVSAAAMMQAAVNSDGNDVATAIHHSARTEPELAPPLISAERKPTTPTNSAIYRRTSKRLKRGQLVVDGRLDLHGMTRKQAYGALVSFITASRAMNRRMVLIVTGKGWNPTAMRPEDAVGVLRRSVPRWLETPPFTQHVASITDAHVKHGGSGALYVLLRRINRSKIG